MPLLLSWQSDVAANCSRIIATQYLSSQNTVCKNERFTLAKKIFRQINSLLISMVNCCFHEFLAKQRMLVNFRNFHTVQILLCSNRRRSNRNTIKYRGTPFPTKIIESQKVCCSQKFLLSLSLNVYHA